MSYTVNWFVPNGSQPLVAQAERASAGQWLRVSPEMIALRLAVAKDIQELDPTLEIHPSARGSDDGCWIGSDDPDCLVPYVELGNGTAMVQGGLGADEDFNETLLHVYSILERNGFVGYDPHCGKIFHGVEGAIELQTGRPARDDGAVV